ncbi:MAG: hypothetical protein PHW04_06570 [Candidatus Wallbacteria bacterium]|nr:hypothetical protein [Candidatus Wallbacteria bacterium]
MDSGKIIRSFHIKAGLYSLAWFYPLQTFVYYLTFGRSSGLSCPTYYFVIYYSVIFLTSWYTSTLLTRNIPKFTNFKDFEDKGKSLGSVYGFVAFFLSLIGTDLFSNRLWSLQSGMYKHVRWYEDFDTMIIIFGLFLSILGGLLGRCHGQVLAGDLYRILNLKKEDGTIQRNNSFLTIRMKAVKICAPIFLLIFMIPFVLFGNKQLESFDKILSLLMHVFFSWICPVVLSYLAAMKIENTLIHAIDGKKDTAGIGYKIGAQMGAIIGFMIGFAIFPQIDMMIVAGAGPGVIIGTLIGLPIGNLIADSYVKILIEPIEE